MNNFIRKNTLLSLCGLNCGLCTMRRDGHCGGCGNGSQSCRIARCSREHGAVEYCYECEHYPCDKYDGIDEFDSFITHRNQKSDMDKAKRIGIDEYNAEQTEKIAILNTLLSDFNDGRRKTFFSVAVNLLEIAEIQDIMRRLERDELQSLSIKEKSAYVSRLFLDTAGMRNIELRLRRKNNHHI